MTETKRPLKVFLCHAHSDKDTVKALYDRLTTPPQRFGAGEDGVDIMPVGYAWLDKENLVVSEDEPASQIMIQSWKSARL